MVTVNMRLAPGKCNRAARSNVCPDSRFFARGEIAYLHEQSAAGRCQLHQSKRNDFHFQLSVMPPASRQVWHALCLMYMAAAARPHCSSPGRTQVPSLPPLNPVSALHAQTLALWRRQ
jgi:hypothetical protein